MKYNQTRSNGNFYSYGSVNYKRHNKTRRYGNEYEYRPSIKNYILVSLVLILLSGIFTLAGHWDYQDEFPEEFTAEELAEPNGFFAGLFE